MVQSNKVYLPQEALLVYFSLFARQINAIRYIPIVPALLLALLFAQSASAQKALCASINMGSAVGAGECYSYKVKAAEQTWRALVEKDAKARAEISEHQEWMYEIIKLEAKSWRAHLKDKCLLDAAGTAGMVQWDYAYALSCEADALQGKIKKMRKSIDFAPI